MFSRYFQSELSYLRELGKEFAERHPAFAGLFAERGGDPDVERLLEGFAFLSARIRERIDDAVPEVIEAVAEMAIPQAIRSVPACTIVEFDSRGGSRRSYVKLPAGTQVASKAVEGCACVFETTAELVVPPFDVGRSTLDSSDSRRPKLSMTLERRVAHVPQSDRLSLFLHGPQGQAGTLLLWFANHLKAIKLVVKGEAGPQEVRVGTAVRLPGFRPDHGMLPWPNTAPEGLRQLQEYFTLPAKFCFVEVEGVATAWGEDSPDEATLVFEFDQPPELPERFEPECLRLGCVPARNLFRTDAEPVTMDLRHSERLLRAAGMKPDHIEVYDVSSVVGMRRRDQRRRNYQAFYRFAHLEADNDIGGYYTLRRALSPLDDGVDTYISLGSAQGAEASLEDEVLSLELLCTNRRLPEELRAGDVCEATSHTPSSVEFRNLTRVSRPVQRRPGAEEHWRTVSHLALNLTTLCRAEELRGLLRLYNVQERSDQQLGRANERRIEAIRDVSVVATRLVRNGVAVPLLRINVEVEESGFASIGDAFLFGSVLDELFVSEAPINMHCQLTVLLHPSRRELQWQARTGTQPPF